MRAVATKLEIWSAKPRKILILPMEVNMAFPASSLGPNSRIYRNGTLSALESSEQIGSEPFIAASYRLNAFGEASDYWHKYVHQSLGQCPLCVPQWGKIDKIVCVPSAIIDIGPCHRARAAKRVCPSLRMSKPISQIEQIRLMW